MTEQKQARLTGLERQVGRVERKLDRLNTRSNAYKSSEVMIFVVGAFATIAALLLAKWLGGLVMVVAIVIFVIVHLTRKKIDESIVYHNAWLIIKKSQVARLRLDWSKIPGAPAQEREKDHPFEVDLDISGERSLSHLINTTSSLEGFQLLREWLLNRSPDIDDIAERQGFIQELAPLSRFRDKLRLYSLLATRYGAEQLEGERLLEWLDEHAPVALSMPKLIVSVALSALSLLLFGLFVFAILPPWYCIISLAVSLIWFLTNKKDSGNLFEDISYLGRTLDKLSLIFTYLERYPYGKHAQLRALCEPYVPDDRSRRPSVLLKQLSRLAIRASFTSSVELDLIVNTIIPWDMYLARRVNRIKAQIVELLPDWLDVWYELEALCALANFAYLNPEYMMPQVVERGEKQAHPIIFEARGIGHPLIPPEQKVVNDFVIERFNEIVLITGSNMAGKSTFLRTLGINLCLAYAGAPVNASYLQTALFDIFACIKVSDSVIDGYSYFYAEVRRLKAMLNELSQSRNPVLFLIDEIFKGTNNYERLIGSRAYIRSLVGKNCVGAVSTHDLDLVKLADELPEMQNFHFQEEVVEGHMRFDYLLRPGPSPTRNALKIMQMEGLPIE
jgi:ABC-type multidrug transport system fused ATPase/permease subunit